MKANVFFLTYIHGDVQPGLRLMEIDRPPAPRSNAEPGWASDLVVQQLIKELEPQYGKVILQSVIVIK